MRTSPGECGGTTRGTWVRLTMLLALAVLMLAAPDVDVTGALLTDTTQVSVVVSTLEEFPASNG